MKKGSTQWYKDAMYKLNGFVRESLEVRHKRMTDRLPKMLTDLDIFHKDQFSKWYANDIDLHDVFIAPYKKPVIIANIGDIDKMSKFATSHMPPIHGIDIVPFPHMEEGKMIFYTPNEKPLFGWPECTNFAPLSKVDVDSLKMTPERQRTIDLHESAHEMSVNFKKKWNELAKPFKTAQEKIFAGKLYYLYKYQALIYCKEDLDFENIVLGGLSHYVSDAKTIITRQKISVNEFFSMTPIELEQKFLHKYPFLTEVNGVWQVVERLRIEDKWTHLPFYLPNALELTDDPNPRSHWPNI